MNQPVLIIAEAGVNHNADIDIAKKLIVAAKECGADIVKFQTAVPEEVMTSQAPKAEYQTKTTDAEESQLAMAKKIHLPLNAFHELIEYSAKTGIEFLTTAFDPVSLHFVMDLNLRYCKIPSGEITNLPYLQYVGRRNMNVILSTGMSDLHEVESAINVLMAAGTIKENITLLHCNTEYPTPFQDVNLAAMITMQKKFNVNVGYSDHTNGIEVSIAAVALGAVIIEKHFTLDRNMVGPDHKASLEPREFREMVQSIRNIEKAIGDGIKKPSPSEKPNIVIARKSIVARSTIKKGELFTEENLTVKRPGSGISPMRWNQIVGKKAEKDFLKDEQIDL